MHFYCLNVDPAESVESGGDWDTVLKKNKTDIMY